MREETRKHWIGLLMVGIIALCLVASFLKVVISSTRMKGNVVVSFTGQQGTISDRDGNTIFDRVTPCPEILANLVGDTAGIISNSLWFKYQDELTPAFNAIEGLASIQDAKGSTLTTTLLPIQAQEAIVGAFHGNNGVCVAYDYVSGDILTCLSIPSGLDTTSDEPVLFQKALNGTHIPGSTMKVVTMLLALEDSTLDLEAFQVQCNGQLQLSDGTTVICTGCHGTVDIEKALGVSCNIYFGEIAQHLDIAKANAVLNSIGIYTDGEDHDQYVDILWRASSSTSFLDRGFDSTWALVGQGHTTINAFDAATICGAIASRTGETAIPRFVKTIYHDDKDSLQYESRVKTIQLLGRDTASAAKDYWRNAYSQYYPNIDGVYSAKTGTIQTEAGNHRALLGYLENSPVAFFIYVESDISNTQLFQIAGVLSQQVQYYY